MLIRRLVFSFCALIITGCGYTPGQSLATDGIVGGAIGAGGGAIVGTLLKNGDVAASAALGAAVAVPVVVAASYYYQDFKKSRELSRNSNEISKNSRNILDRDAQIEELRKKVIDDSSEIRFDDDINFDPPYTGATIGF